MDESQLVDYVRAQALPLHSERDMEPLLSRIGSAKCVMLGEASHGTSEFYLWREAISRRLIEDYDFDFIAVEGDWPDCFRINRYVKGHDGDHETAHEVLSEFRRWPTWMWANREVERLADRLRERNVGLPRERRAGFYGLDVYSLWESMEAVIGYLQERSDPGAVEDAKRAYGCFEPYGRDAQSYAWSTAFAPASCEEDVVRVLRELRTKSLTPERGTSESGSGELRFDAEQNALVARNAERYYRTMIRSGPGSWNVRDEHMMDTLQRLLDFHGPDSKAIVWAHNTHIGDARATDMVDAGMFNLGQLARERIRNTALVGFGSYEGHVIAADQWGASMERMEVPSGEPGSWEDLLHDGCGGDCMILFDAASIPEAAFASRGHRAIGVVYHPERERYGNYVPTVLPGRYDAFVFVDRTHAVHPLHMPSISVEELPETYPVGV